MARRYRVVFVRPATFTHPDGDVTELVGSGNTRRSAEQSARRALKRSGADPRTYYTRSIRHVKDGSGA